jgi:hypothetical protein
LIRKTASLALLLIGASTFAFAAVPEIDPGMAGNAVALLAGALVIIHSRRRR